MTEPVANAEPWLPALVAACCFCGQRTESLTGPVSRVVVCPPSKSRAICTDCLREATSAAARYLRVRNQPPKAPPPPTNPPAGAMREAIAA